MDDGQIRAELNALTARCEQEHQARQDADDDVRRSFTADLRQLRQRVDAALARLAEDVGEIKHVQIPRLRQAREVAPDRAGWRQLWQFTERGPVRSYRCLRPGCAHHVPLVEGDPLTVTERAMRSHVRVTHPPR